MKKLITIFTLALSVLTHSAYAEKAATLKGLADPSFAEEEVADPSFPAHLERVGDIPSAILEWQRIIFKTSDKALKARARIKLAKLQIKQEAYAKAFQTLSKLGAESPNSPHMAEALYLMSVMSDLTKDYSTGDTYRKRLHQLFVDSAFISESERHTLWHRALQGLEAFPEVHTPEAQALKTRLELTPATDDATASTATLLSVIPGLGHFYLGDWRTAFMAFLFNGIFLWALISALRSKQWAYSMVFGLLVSILYFGTMFSAHSLAQRDAFELRMNKMKTWGDLAPSQPQSIKPIIISSVHPLRSPLWVYRNIVGRFDGARGNGYPVNSLYAKQAYDKHGLALGSLMTVDRLLRDWREIERPMAEVYTDNRLRYVDPLSRNDFWLGA